MSESVVEFNYSKTSQDSEGHKLQKIETPNVDYLETCNTSSQILSSIDLGIFGYKFSGPEMFMSQAKADTLNREILYYIEHRRSSGGRNILKNVKRNSLGNTSGLCEMSKFFIKFNNTSMEKLYSLNVNDWMFRRIPFISILILIITVIFWPVSVVSFKKTGAWEDHQYIFVLFHVIMTMSAILGFSLLAGFFDKFYSWTETICYVALGTINFIWGCWLISSSYALRQDYSNSSIDDFIVARGALKALTYSYSILPIVALDSFIPTRSSKTFWIHFQFIVLSSIYTITKGHVNSTCLSWVYIVFKICAYASIISLLYFGSYNSELQTRISFFNWITTSRKIEVLEKDIAEAKSPDKSFTPAETILVAMRRCLKIANQTMDAVGDMLPEISGSLNHMCKELKTCINQLTNSPNIYSIPRSQIYRNLGDEADMVETYIASFSRPAYSTSSGSKSVAFSQQPLLTFSSDISLSRYLSTVTKVETVNLYQLLNDWNFSILGHFREHDNPFVSLGYSLLSEFETHYGVPHATMLNFLSVVEGLYRNVSYHNCIHGIFVAQKMCCLANFVGIYENMSVLDRAIIVVAGMCHDIGHPGKTNSFFVKTGHEIAHLFNDKAVLENFHSCLTFKVLKMSECNIFSSLSRDEFRDVRRKIIELILATDMEDHFESISRFRLKRISQEFSLETELWNISKMLIKASDIGSACVSWNLCYEWAQRILREFYYQGDLEKRLDLPVSALCDSSRHRDVPKAQSGFLRLVVSPLYEELSKLPHLINTFDKTEALLETGKPGKSGSSLCISDSDGDESRDLSQQKRSSRQQVHASDGFHNAQPVNSNALHSRNLNDLDFPPDQKKPLLDVAQTTSNRVFDVCIVQLRQNIERWEQMADLGETLPINDFNHQNIDLDINLLIQN